MYSFLIILFLRMMQRFVRLLIIHIVLYRKDFLKSVTVTNNIKTLFKTPKITLSIFRHAFNLLLINYYSFKCVCFLKHKLHCLPTRITRDGWRTLAVFVPFIQSFITPSNIYLQAVRFHNFSHTHT